MVGHNLKIAWNLMRMHHLKPNDAYVALARKIADVMPGVGSDRQRGGWYDVVERVLDKGQECHRFVWHDRKAWWQQEQAILAYFILAGSLGDQNTCGSPAKPPRSTTRSSWITTTAACTSTCWPTACPT